MKALTITGIVLVAVIAGFFMFSSPAPENNSSETLQSQPTQSDELTMDTIKADIEQGAQLLDVRTQEEYDESYIESAELFPLVDMQAGKFPELAKDTKLYVYCRTGNRSAQAKTLLEKEGFSDVIDLGGLEDVVNIGAKLVTPN